MGEKAADLRVTRTRQLLRDALTRLLMQRPLKDISVTMLAKQAGINRGTFYLHYRDVYDLYSQVESEIIREFARIFDMRDSSDRRDVLLSAVWDTFYFLEKNADLCFAILHTSESSFLQKLLDISRERGIRDYQAIKGRAFDEALYDYYYAFVTSGCVGLLRAWFFGGRKEPIAKIAGLAEELVLSCIGAVE